MKLIWVHEDCLHRASPAFRAAGAGSPALFVFDDAELERAGWTLKRIGFIYECLLDLPVTIRRGDPAVEVPRFAAEQGCTGFVTVASPDRRIQRIAAGIGAEVLPEDPFVEIKGKVDLARFSRYWRKAERVLLPGADSR